MLFYLLGVVLFLCILHVLLNYNERARLIKKIPSPKLQFIVGDAVTIGLKSPVEIMKLVKDFGNTYDGIYGIWAWPVGVVVVYNPDDLEKILSNMKYSEKGYIYKFIKPWLGDGLLVSKGAKWQERRKILTPAFHFNILKQFFEIILKNSDVFVDNIEGNCGISVDVRTLLSDFTLHSICETAMGTQLDKATTGEAKSYKQSLHHLGLLVSERIQKLHLYGDFIFNLSSVGREHNRHVKTVHSFTESVIKKRRHEVEKFGVNLNDAGHDDDDSYVYKKKKKTAMLDLLLLAEKEGAIDNVGIQEEVDTFMFEGHDTTACGLAFFVILIANYKSAQKKIQEELYEIFGDTKRPIEMGDLNKMKYMECCIKESLRMYPPVPFLGRTLGEDTMLSGYKIPAGTMIMADMLSLHYRSDIYKNPEQFDPDRFLPENSVGLNSYAYIPFSAGPRNCIGQKFAMMEMKIAIAKMLQEFDLEPVTRPEDIRLIMDIVLQHDGPMLVKFIKRK